MRDPSPTPPVSSPSHPRVLIVTEFAPDSGGGSWVLLKQLLRGLDWNEIYWWSLFSSAATSRTFGGRHKSFNLPGRLAPNLRSRQLKGFLLENFFIPFAARDIVSCVRSVKPDFILYLAHLWAIPAFYRALSDLGVPWHLSLHDMPDTNGAVGRLGAKRASRFLKYTETMYREAASRDVISPAMAEEMRQKTGVSCPLIFRCAVEPEILQQLSGPPPPPRDEVIRIGYAGTIIAESTFARLVGALRIARERLGRKVELHLYSWHDYRGREWFDPSLIIQQESRGGAAIYPDDYPGYTWGLAIMNLEDDDPRYNRFSFPCKFTASLAAGLPLICLGHPQSALVELVKDYGVGLLITDPTVEGIADRLCEGLADFSRFDSYRRELRRCAEAEFNAARNRETLHGLMRRSGKGEIPIS